MSVFVPKPQDSVSSSAHSVLLVFTFLILHSFSLQTLRAQWQLPQQWTKIRQWSWTEPAKGQGSPEPDSTAQGSPVVPLWYQTCTELEGQLHGPDPIWIWWCSRLVSTGISFFMGMHISFNTWSEMHQSRWLTLIQRAWYSMHTTNWTTYTICRHVYYIYMCIYLKP